MLEEAASILVHHQTSLTEKQAEESGNLLFSSSLSSTGLRQRRPMNSLSTATVVEGSSVSAPGGGGTNRAKNPLPPPKASTLVGISNSAGNPADSTNFSSASNRAEDQKMQRSSLGILESAVETPGEGVVDATANNYQRCWVLIFGVTSSVFTTVLYPKLESFGTIERNVISSSNWMAIQYSTELQAEKACCQNGSTLTLEDGNTFLIGVLRCTPQLYNQLRIPSYLSSSNRNAISSSTVDQLPSATPSSTPAISFSRIPSTTKDRQQSRNQNDDEDIFLHSTSAPAADDKSKGIIGSILGWFFMW